MQFLYRLLPARIEMVTLGPTPEEAAIVGEHFAHLEALTEQGVMLLVGRTQNNDEDTFGLCIFQAESEESARRIMNDDPAVGHHARAAVCVPHCAARPARRLIDL